ncbi:PHP domain-containing protein [Candidatus Villigracilis affinis]|uniref:PHP domain-containing protein n=1 Tax=Candidatus Villigracilis affinis TaxID=3140682 RepID=UPI002A1A8EEF|nr:PHP domain-containing protein [Anaerolineales bacterium]
MIVQEALEHNIDIIAITDHNASANVAAVQKAAHGTSLTVLGGMEVQSREDVHLLCLLIIPKHLQSGNPLWMLPCPTHKQRRIFGEQFVVDESGEFIRNEPRMLLTSTHFSIDEIFERVNALGGLVIPAHVDRTSYGLFPTLGLLSDKWQILALEISRHITPERAAITFPSIKDIPLIQNGDVHRLDEFLAKQFYLPSHRWPRSEWHYEMKTSEWSISNRHKLTDNLHQSAYDIGH